ncbi:sigma-70 family RNA polymerase sigma factor [Streptomyces sp. SID3343]|uniref:sigma-70 family RNA polymerase sigma factor n=1 Tax=Streptomyces sp. SID3343 TaxID=2690260 RepID=UPI00136C803F|nr:sigma-70 family RNA polymerase sigma factor [Streptomyces sp. SID3343]MYV98985.1 sigma-70 family RNA polymerase sigma factor [Streptomyces sp. SID3343]
MSTSTAAPPGGEGSAGRRVVGAGGTAYGDTERLLSDLALLERGTREHTRLREEIVERNLNLVGFVCRPYRRRPDLGEDIRQVAAMGLVKAVDGYRPGQGNGFMAYALPTMRGEVKRFFRDCVWEMHVARADQELFLATVRTRDAMTHALGREPTDDELGEEMGLSAERVRAALAVSRARRVGSLDRPVDGEEGGGSRYDMQGAEDPGLDLVEHMVALRRVIPDLDDRDRRILKMRFWDDLTQAQIGETLGLSQMHVSRLLTRAFACLRQGIHTA